MTLSAVSNTILAKNHASQQKSGTATEQSGSRTSNSSADSSNVSKKIDDSVTLSQPEKTTALSRVLDAEAAEKLLPRTMNAILEDSKTAISAQANMSHQAAQEFLANS